MNYLKRHWFTILIIILLPLPLVFLWRSWPVNGTSELWSKSENRVSFIINLASSFVYSIIGILFFTLRDRTKRWGKALLLRRRTIEEEHKRVIQEEIYLDNLVARLSRDFPWDTEKYTELEAIQEDLENQAKRLRPRLWQLPDSKETQVDANIRTHVRLQRFLAVEKHPIMLKGDPGTGKTLTVRRFVVDQAKLAKSRLPDEVKIPIYVPLELYTGKTEGNEPEPVYDFLYRYLKEEFPASAHLREHLSEYLLSGRVVLVFDGLNELPPDEYTVRYKKLEEFVFRKYPRGKYIFTCRTLRHTSLSRFSTVAINELDNEKIKRFIAAYQGPERAAVLFHELTSGDGFMLRVCRNPFMLQMLVRRDPTRPTPSSSAKLFVEYINDRLAGVSGETGKIINALCKMAFGMQKEGLFAGTSDIDSLRKHLRSASFENYLEIARRAQLIDYTPEKKVRFYHQVLQEHFSALALAAQWKSGKDIESYREDYRWEETVIVCSSLVGDAEKFIREIWSDGDLPPNRLWLAIKCIGNSGRGVSQTYYDEILKSSKTYLQLNSKSRKHPLSPTVSAVETLKSLSYIDDLRVNRIVNSTLLDNEGWIREVCAQILGNSRHPDAKTLLASSAIRLRSLRFFLLIAPFYERKQLIRLVAGSPLFLYFTVDFFFTLIAHSFRFVPFLIIPVMFIFSTALGMSFVDLAGRMFALIILSKLLGDKIVEADLLSTRNPLKVKLGMFFKSFGWLEAIFIGLAILAWIFSAEVLLLAYIIQLVLVFLIAGWVAFDFIKHLRPLKKLIYRLYSHGLYRASMIVFLGLFAVMLSFVIMIWINPSIPTEQTRTISAVESTLRTLEGFIAKLLFIPFFIVMIIGFLSSCVHLIAFIKYLGIRRLRKLAMRDDTEASKKILDIALDNSKWTPTREQAIKALRLIDVPPERLSDLESLISSFPELRRELEQTVYELRVQTLRNERTLHRHY